VVGLHAERLEDGADLRLRLSGHFGAAEEVVEN